MPSSGPSAPDAPDNTAGGQVSVEFLAVPVDAYLALQEWNDAVIRECELIAALGPGRSDLSPRLLDLAARLSSRFAVDSDGYRESVSEALGRGAPSVDLLGVWHEPTAPSLAAAEAFLAMMEELDGFCRSDTLLTEPPDTVVVRLRRWFVEEMRSQLLDHAPPHPFRGPDEAPTS
jgi:hypothetical protein